MSILRNPKHERFSQELASGKSASEAYALAGFKPNRGNASTLKRQDAILKRVDEILRTREHVEAEATALAVKKTGLTKAWVLERLQMNAERALQVRAVVDSDGKPTGQFKYDGSVANRALELIGKELGMFVDRREQGKPGGFAAMTDAELAADLKARLMARGLTELQANNFLRGNINGAAPIEKRHSWSRQGLN